MGNAIYKNMKSSKDGLPTWDSLIPHVLKYVIEKNKAVSRIEIKVDVADSLELTEKLRNQVYNSKNGDNTIENRVAFAISSLKRSGMIQSISRGLYSATEEGKEYFNRYGMKLDRNIVESTNVFKRYYNEKEQTTFEKEAEKNDLGSYDLLENINEQIDKLKQEKKENLLRIILNSSPYLLEKMVVILLSKMGYKGDNGSEIVTKKSNDGGIDGIINQDPLGTQTVYVQVKRYTDKNVQRQEIEAFYGALRRINASRGVFITTSDFSKHAKETADQFSIIMIDKNKLLDLLIEYEVGVEIDQTFYTYKIDEEFFEEN